MKPANDLLPQGEHTNHYTTNIVVTNRRLNILLKEKLYIGFNRPILEFNPVIMRAASSCTLSRNSDSCKLQLSQTILPYSSIGRLNPIYNFSFNNIFNLLFVTTILVV
jgi:hypothetical protein